MSVTTSAGIGVSTSILLVSVLVLVAKPKPTKAGKRETPKKQPYTQNWNLQAHLQTQDHQSFKCPNRRTEYRGRTSNNPHMSACWSYS